MCKHVAAVLYAEPAEEVTGYLVDETDDPEFENSRSYDAEYRPCGADDSSGCP